MWNALDTLNVIRGARVQSGEAAVLYHARNSGVQHGATGSKNDSEVFHFRPACVIKLALHVA